MAEHLKNRISNKQYPSEARSFVESNMYNWNGEPEVFKPSEPLIKGIPIVVDLFCGMGGLSFGFEMAGFQTALGLDIHAPSIETFTHSHPRSAAILGDIRKIMPLESNQSTNLVIETLKDTIGESDVDVLMAGIPCQGFSLSNRKRNILDERNYLFLYFMKFVELLNPKFILIENVSGLKSMNGGQFVIEIENSLKSLNRGYENVNHNVLHAAGFGVPQIRRRVIFLASKPDYRIVWPSPSHNGKSKPYRNFGDATSDLPLIEANEETNTYRSDVDLTEYQKIMRLGSNNELYNHIAPNHPDSTIKKIGNTTPGKPIYPKYTQRIRLSLENPSPTQVSGGIRPQYQFGHPINSRGLTVRERCRIQSIPDKVRIFGGIVQGRVQTGNAVPPLLAKAIAHNIYFEFFKKEIRQKLIEWCATNSRAFPWRQSQITPYEVLVSEMMLRKTKAENIVGIYKAFIEKYPGPKRLSQASMNEMIKLIKPIGIFIERSQAFIKLGTTIMEKYDGEIPKTFEDLESMPHVGRYIANATLMFGWGVKRPIVDGNIQRLFNRLSGIQNAIEIHKANYLWEIADSLIPNNNFKVFSWSLLDFAAIICKPRNPNHKQCPFNELCIYNRGVLIDV